MLWTFILFVIMSLLVWLNFEDAYRSAQKGKYGWYIAYNIAGMCAAASAIWNGFDFFTKWLG